MILPNVIEPPAPIPQTALAMMKLSMLPASAHHVVAKTNTTREAMYSGFRPTASDSRPSSGWNAVDVSKNAVESHDAEFAERK